MLGAGAEECKGIDCPAALGDRNRLQALVAGGTVALHGTEPADRGFDRPGGDAAGVKWFGTDEGTNGVSTAATGDKGAGAQAPIIEIDHVTKSFTDFIAVDDADFSIGQGEFFAMLGPSGCGKTTTLRMIAGFETPTSGAIRLDGEDVSRTPRTSATSTRCSSTTPSSLT